LGCHRASRRGRQSGEYLGDIKQQDEQSRGRDERAEREGVNTEFQTTKNPPRRVFLILAEGLLSRR
jgi:hypothetical protein